MKSNLNYILYIRFKLDGSKEPSPSKIQQYLEPVLFIAFIIAPPT